MWLVIFIVLILICSLIISIYDLNIKESQYDLNKKIVQNFPYQIKRDMELYQSKFGKIIEYYTSWSVVQNSKNNPFKYICKYFDLPVGKDLKTMLEKKKTEFHIKDVEMLRKKIICDTNAYILSYGETSYNAHLLLKKMFNYDERVVFDRIITEDDLADIYRLKYSDFCYNDILLNIENINRFIEYVDKLRYSFANTKDTRRKMTPQLRAQVLARDNYTCQKCGVSIYKEPNLLLEVDHIVPVSKGGKTIIDNLQTLCWRCNRQKSNN